MQDEFLTSIRCLDYLRCFQLLVPESLMLIYSNLLSFNTYTNRPEKTRVILPVSIQNSFSGTPNKSFTAQFLPT